MFLKRFFSAAASSVRPALRTIFWILKLMLPITLGVSYLQYFGVIEGAAVFFAPAFELMGLGGEAVVVFLTSILLNIYSAIAVIATLGFDYRSVTILSVMCLIAHNLIMETAIQKKTGASVSYVVMLRILSAVLAGVALNLILPSAMDGKLILSGVRVGEPPASPIGVFTGWLASIWRLSLQMCLMIAGLNLLQSILREFGVIRLLNYPLRPFMKLFGLAHTTSFLWIVANCVGLAYGGALMVDEIGKGEVDPEEANRLNTHIAVSHSLLEDTLLFLSIGIGWFWLLVPRLALAILWVWIRRAVTGSSKMRTALEQSR